MNVADSLQALDRQLGVPGVASVVQGNGGLPKVRIAGAAATGEVYLHGAHVTSWKPRGADEVLFVSRQSHWQDGHPIRGGVPICFPWFAANAANPKAPMHGLVRTQPWQLCTIEQQGDAVAVTLSIDSNETTRRWCPADFHVTYRVTFGAELRLELEVHNTGTTPLRFEEALHTYLRVSDIQKVQLHGLDGVHYLDKTDQFRQKMQQGPVVIESETDRIYLNTPHTVEIEDRALARRISVAKENSIATVVWNPWVAKAKAMSDFGDDEWREMVCVETCNVGDVAVEVAAGQRHRMAAMTRICD